MGQRGPSKTPVPLQLVRGDPRQRGKAALAAMLDDQVRPPVEIPELPNYLRFSEAGPRIAVEARAEWERITPYLQKLGLISQIDRAALVGYCFWWAVQVVAQKKVIELGEEALVKATPSGYEQLGPWMLAASKASAEVKAHLAQFGLSPAARSRVTASDPQLGLPGVEGAPKEDGWAGFPEPGSSSA